ncbi:MAG TPA: hypothetical protein DCQ93_07070 [Bacteroidetes bacterium]|nr:hypothetical protein [Bacteroidota bacterium]
MGPALSAIRIELKALEKESDINKLKQNLNTTVHTVDKTFQHIRESISNLRPVNLNNGLENALINYRNFINESFRKNIEYHFETNIDELDN